MKEVTSLYEKHGGKLVGFWWSLGGEKNEALWLSAWKDTKDWEKGEEETWSDKNFPMEKVSSTIITYSDRILKPAAMSPMK